jgi:two-component system, chemotaxis family, response regulator Rcp1
MPRLDTPVEILLVEDSPDDADLMIDALRDGKLDVRIAHIEDGEDAIRFLRRERPHEAVGRPDLILLDLHLPCKNGFEVLAEIKQDSDLRRIPVVILTSSDTENDFVTAYDLHANCCVAKPVDQDEYARVVKKIEHFWLHVAQRAR